MNTQTVISPTEAKQESVGRMERIHPADLTVGFEFIKDGERFVILNVQGWLGWVFPVYELPQTPSEEDEEDLCLDGEILNLRDLYRGLIRGEFRIPSSEEEDDSDVVPDEDEDD